MFAVPTVSSESAVDIMAARIAAITIPASTGENTWPTTFGNAADASFKPGKNACALMPINVGKAVIIIMIIPANQQDLCAVFASFVANKRWYVSAPAKVVNKIGAASQIIYDQSPVPITLKNPWVDLFMFNWIAETNPPQPPKRQRTAVNAAIIPPDATISWIKSVIVAAQSPPTAAYTIKTKEATAAAFIVPRPTIDKAALVASIWEASIPV